METNMIKCHACKTRVKESQAEMIGDFWVCNDCIESGYIACEDCGACGFHEDHHYGDYYCPDCWDDLFTTCDRCQDTIRRWDAHCNYDRVLCADCWDTCRCEFEPQKTITRTTRKLLVSKRSYGVELETSACDNSAKLFGGYWGSQEDGSIEGMEFYSTILTGDTGFKAIDSLLDFARKHDWDVSSRCGYHLHLDLSEESIDHLKAIAIAYHLTQDIWHQFVQHNRKTNNFCKRQKGSITKYLKIASIDEWTNFCYGFDRYSWVNWAAYIKYRTLEIRIHEGTLDPQQVKNWIRAHTAFVDWACKVGVVGVKKAFYRKFGTTKYQALCKVWEEAGYSDLAEFYQVLCLA